jgi:hypothetical protein
MSGVPILEGYSLLSTVHRANLALDLGLAYRGDATPMIILEPKTPTWPMGERNYPDGDVAVVCADSTPFRPIFRTLSPRSEHSYQIRHNADGTVNFYVAKQKRRQFLRAIGYVGVYSAADFVLTELAAPPDWPDQAVIRPPELRSESAVVPRFIIKVCYRDFAEFLDEASHLSLEYI